MDASIDCVAITDHNSGAWVDKLKAAYQTMQRSDAPTFRALKLFPGVEISVHGGFHLLAILDTDKGTADIDTLLGAIKYRGTKGDSDSVTRASAVEVVEAVLAAGAIPIPAHVDGDKGMLRLTDEPSRKPVIDANTLRQVMEHPAIRAMEVIDPEAPKPALYEAAKVGWCQVIGSDCHTFRGDHGPGSRYTWVKMETPSLEGLRLALMDGAGFSVVRSDQPAPLTLPDHFVEAVEITKARFMGRTNPARLAFSPRLNALVGGFGTGKSTVVHALRIVARRERDLEKLQPGSDPRAVFERFNRVPEHSRDTGGLQADTRIAWTVMRDGVRHRVWWPARAGEITVEEEHDEAGWRRSRSEVVSADRFPMRIFSQGQIAALAGDDQRALLQVIDDAAGVAKLHSDLAASTEDFLASRARMRQLDRQLADRDDRVVELQDVERKLKRFEDAGHTEVLTAYRRRSRQEREADRQLGATHEAAASIESAAAGLHLDDLPDGLFDADSAEDRQAAAILAKLADLLRAASDSVRTSARRLQDDTQAVQEALDASPWRVAVRQAMDRYAGLVETLREGRVSDPREYGRLAQERQRLEGELGRLDSLQDERSRLESESDALLGRVLEARRAVSLARHEFLESALTGNRFVRIRNLAYNDDPQAIENSLRTVLRVTDDRFREDFSGAVRKLLEGLPEDRTDRGSTFETRIEQLKGRIRGSCTEAAEFGGFFNNYLARECERTPELLDRALTWFPEDGLRVEYSRHGDGKQFQPIAQASAGQRSTAMLAFLLAHGEEPLVLDQPEDDLDNHLIYELIVRQIREQKLKRQIIVVTHNPNVVVNGDAEMVHVLDFHGQSYIRQQGSLQTDAMRDEVCRVMEGGREAFERRYRRLGSEPTHVR